MTIPSISVVIPNYNNGRFLEECISSVFNQSITCLECIVVDDGSTDNSIEILTTLQKNYPKLKIIRQDNLGVSKARNTGWENAKGEWIAYLDADDLWEKGKLESQVLFLTQNRFKVITSKYLWFNEKGTFENLQLKTNPKNPFDYWFDTYASPSGILIQRMVLEEINGWDERLNTCEDMDLWFRLALNNIEIGLVDKSDVLIRTHLKNSKGNFKKMITYHKLSLQKWHSMLLHSFPDRLMEPAYASAVRKKLGKIRYYAAQEKDKSEALKSFWMGYGLLGIKYFINPLVVRQLFFTLKRK